MPIHDWTKVPAGLFHHFHQDWTIELARALNRGLLPKGVSALVEQSSGPFEADVLAVERRTRPQPSALNGGVAVRQQPAVRIVRRTDISAYSERANRVVVRHHLGRIIAVIESYRQGTRMVAAPFANLLIKRSLFCLKAFTS